MPKRSDDGDTTFPRKKARRSCLNCQRSHRTCGNERPCIECKRRSMTETCVDGDRKIPKYLYDMSENPPKIDIYCGANIPDSWALPPNPVNRFGVTFKRRVDLPQNYSPEQGLCDFVDPAILNIESPILLLSQQTTKSHPQEGTNLKAQSLKIDMSSFPALPVGCPGSHGIGSTKGGKTIGFTISSGWSSTFLPCGMSEEPWGSTNVHK